MSQNAFACLSTYYSRKRLVVKRTRLKLLPDYVLPHLKSEQDFAKVSLQYTADLYEMDCKKRTAELAEMLKLDLSRKVRELSLGNKKKVGLVSALMTSPKLLVLDEPTNGLDPLVQQTVYEILREEKARGTTVFFSSHVLGEVQKFCDRVGILRNGKLADLARYAYRTAISNSRVLDVGPETVTIRYTDYADQNRKKELELPGEEFVRRFLMHILPKGFHRVRFAGFLSNCKKARSLRHIGDLRRTPYTGSPVRGKSISELLMMLYGTDILSCPKCHARMSYYRCSHPPAV